MQRVSYTFTQDLLLQNRKILSLNCFTDSYKGEKIQLFFLLVSPMFINIFDRCLVLLWVYEGKYLKLREHKIDLLLDYGWEGHSLNDWKNLLVLSLLKSLPDYLFSLLLIVQIWLLFELQCWFFETHSVKGVQKYTHKFSAFGLVRDELLNWVE